MREANGWKKTGLKWRMRRQIRQAAYIYIDGLTKRNFEIRNSKSEILNIHRGDVVRGGKTENSGIEIQLSLNRSLDVCGFPESMSFGGECDVGEGQSLCA